MPTYKQPSPAKPISVYFTGTDTLAQGYVFCYDLTQTDGSQAWSVAKPATGNLSAFAGVLSDSCIGRVGPCWIEIYPPNQVCNALVEASTLTLNTDRLKIGNASYAFLKHVPGGTLTLSGNDQAIPLEAISQAAAGVALVLLKSSAA